MNERVRDWEGDSERKKVMQGEREGKRAGRKREGRDREEK